jgi:hypothetical protein
LDFDLNLSQIQLSTFQPYFSEIIDNIQGLADLTLGIKGTLKRPEINGNIFFRESSAKLFSTKCTYLFEDNLQIRGNDIIFNNFKLKDEYGNLLSANGNIFTSDFKNIIVDLNLTSNNFNFLSTTGVDNEQFYGNIFATANADLTGSINDMHIRVNAITERGTNLKLPLYNSSEIQTTDFITFVDHSDANIPIAVKSKVSNNQITLDMDLEITSNTRVLLIFDPRVGDIIEASGAGKLKLEIDDDGDFSMFGDILINDGEYLFTLQNVINKRFKVKPGGTISWNGSPISANISLEAIYETKASTYNLSPNPTEEMKNRIPVQCLLYLEGDLANPTIKPSIVLPTAEPETKSLVESSIGTEEELMRQFISLLVINNFISNANLGANPISGGSSNFAGVTASELLSNQLSNWLSQISNDFDIGVNYRPGDDISSDEVELALSTQILNDRIIISGNLDVLGDQVSSPKGPSNIVGDFDLEFKVTEKVSVTAFNQVNDDRILRPSLYTQGIGLLYRSEFNTLKDIFNNRGERKSESGTKSNLQNSVIIKNEELDE